MPYKLSIERDHLSIEIGSSETRERAVTLLNAVSVALFRCAARPTMISALNKAPLTLTDLYTLARALSHTPLRRTPIAFIYDADDSFESSRFIESIAEENGLHLAAFKSPVEALRWLHRFGADNAAGCRLGERAGANRTPLAV
jgi:hypothetical protein